MESRPEFVKRLLYFRDNDESEAEFRKRAGLDRFQWSRMCKTIDVAPTVATIRAVADELGLSREEREWLTYGDGPPPKRRGRYFVAG